MDRSASAISTIVKQILSKYGESLNQKLITYNGASVMSGHTAGIQVFVRKDYPYAYFFHCAARRLNLVLCQSASAIPKVKVFFANVSAFSSFTSVSTKRKSPFQSHTINIPQPGETRWYYHSRAISVIDEKYSELIDVLEEMVENPRSWDDTSLSQGSGLPQYLDSFLCCFFLGLFNNILQQSSVLYMFHQNRNIDFSFTMSKIDKCLLFLADMHTDDAYDNLDQATIERIGHSSSRTERRIGYKQLYFEVIDNCSSMMKERFTDCKDYEFLNLVNPKLFSQWKSKVPATKLGLLQSKYGPLFYIPTLASQLLFFYNDVDFIKESPADLLKYMYDFHLQTSLPEMVRLLTLNSVIAVSSASVER